MPEDNQETVTQPDEVTLEDVKLEEEVTPPASLTDIEPVGIPEELLQMFGIGMAGLPPVNLRSAEPFHDVEFKALLTHTENEGDPAPGYESFLGSEFEAKLNAAVEQKLNLKFLYRCPNKPDCPEDWHQYCVVYQGDEYVDWFIATKMGVRNGVWVDERKVAPDGEVRHTTEASA